MSTLYDKIINDIEEYVKEYAKIISEKYSLNFDEVFSLWGQNIGKDSLSHFSKVTKKSPKRELKSSSPSSKDIKQTVEDLNLEISNLAKYNKKELEAICKSKGLKVSGKKEELVERIMVFLQKDDLKTDSGESKNETKQQKINKILKPTAKRSPKQKDDSPVVKAQEAHAPIYSISRNKWGNYEHVETHLVFDRETQTVYGKQNDDGSVSDLTSEDVENCNKHKFKFKLPENLDKGKKTLENVKVDEVDEQVEEVEEVEELQDDEEYEEVEVEEEVFE